LAITLIAGIKQANNGTFALVDSNDIHGGLYHVDLLTEIQNIPLERIKDGMLCYVSETKLYYKCNATVNKDKQVIAVQWEEFYLGSNSNNNNNNGDSGNDGGDSGTTDPNPDPDNPGTVYPPSIEDIYAHIFVSDVAPDNVDMFWYDTTEEEIGGDEENDSYTLSDAKASIESLIGMVTALESRVKFLEENGVSGPGNNNGGSTSAISKYAVLTESGQQVLLENGRVAVVESYIASDTSEEQEPEVEEELDEEVEALLRSVDKLLLED
jgi:hypothetical protein